MDSSEYVRRVLEAYRSTPGTCGVVRQPDRVFALQLFARGVPLAAVENAMVLACARRLARPADAVPLSLIRIIMIWKLTGVPVGAAMSTSRVLATARIST